MKILVVEDDPTNLKLISIILSSGGHKVFDSVRAESALEIVKKEAPDIVLLDLVLPDMSGIVLAKIIKEDKQTSHIPIIALTGYPDKFRQKDISFAGFDAYIVKPVSTNMLTDMVEGVFACRKKQDEETTSTEM